MIRVCIFHHRVFAPCFSIAENVYYVVVTKFDNRTSTIIAIPHAYRAQYGIISGRRRIVATAIKFIRNFPIFGLEIETEIIYPT